LNNRDHLDAAGEIAPEIVDRVMVSGLSWRLPFGETARRANKSAGRTDVDATSGVAESRS